MIQPIIAGNWKMHKTNAEASDLAKSIVKEIATEKHLPRIVLCPPFTAIETVRQVCQSTEIKIGAQNMNEHQSGAYTGEISAAMLKAAGVQYVIIGHSERRQLFGETNSNVNAKLKIALQHDLIPIVCVGETVDERDNNLTDAVVSRQVAAALSGIDVSQLGNLVIAYEPVWAIGTGNVCASSEANRVAKLIRSTFGNLYNNKKLAASIPILYGGSVKPDNIDEQLKQSDINGALVGGASLKANEFLSLVRSAQKCLSSTVS